MERKLNLRYYDDDYYLFNNKDDYENEETISLKKFSSDHYYIDWKIIPSTKNCPKGHLLKELPSPIANIRWMIC